MTDFDRFFAGSTLGAGARLPWDDPSFSERMLAEHLDERHDLASRRGSIIDAHVEWLDGQLGGPARVLDLGCGPGLYTDRLAARGHRCHGVDVSPAAIAYATERATRSGSACTYAQADLRGHEVEDAFELVLLLYGELNTFDRVEIEAIFASIARALAPGGRAVVELSTEVGVLAKATRPNSWYRADGGLFARGRHLVLYESAWDLEASAAVEQWHVIEGAAAVSVYTSTTWVLTDKDIDAMLVRSGLRRLARCGDLTGKPWDPDLDMQTLVFARA